ncbi:MAG: FtsX-like permease family protein [Acidimicrobiales bacterium]
MWKVTLKGIWAKKLRFISTMVAIVLGVGFMAGTFVLTDTVAKTFDDLFASVYKGTDAVVEPKEQVNTQFGIGTDRLPAETLAKVRTASGVARAEGFVQGYAQLVKPNGKALGGQGAPTFGQGWIEDSRLNPFKVVTGHAPAGDDEIAIDKSSFDIGKYHVGDSVKVLSPSPVKSYKIVGVLRFGSADSPAGASIIAFTPPEAARVFKTSGAFDAISIVAQAGVPQEQLKVDVAKLVATDKIEVLTGTEITKKTQSDIKKQLKGFNVVLVGFSGVALFVGSFIIYNTFSILVAQRTREMALLRALGAGRGQVVRSVLGEALIVGIVASLLGIGFGLLTALGLKAGFALLGFSLPGGSLVLAARTVIVTLVVGILVTLVFALFPAIKGSRVPPVAAMRDVAIDRSGTSRVRTVIGLILFALGVVEFVTGLTSKGTSAAKAVGFSALLTLVAVIILGPVIARPMGRVLGAPIKRLRGVVGALAQANAVRNPKRTSLTALALTIGVALVGFILVFTASFKGLIAKTVDGTFKADYIVANKTFSGFSPVVADEIDKVDGVDVASPLRFGEFKANGAKTTLVAFDTATITKVLDVPMKQGKITDVVAGTIAAGDRQARNHGWKIGDPINVVFPKSGPATLTLAATVDDTKIQSITQGSTWLVSTDTYDQGFRDPVDFQLFVKLKPGANLDKVSDDITKVLKDYPTAELQDKVQYKRSVGDQLNKFVSLILLLLALSIVIAMFGIANTLMLSIYERRRELGLLRAVGMTKAQTRSTIRWESVIMAVLGTLLGLAIGVIFGVAIMRALRDQGFTVLVVPVGTLIVVTVIAAAFGVLAAIRPSIKAARLDVLEAIGSE